MNDYEVAYTEIVKNNEPLMLYKRQVNSEGMVIGVNISRDTGAAPDQVRRFFDLREERDRAVLAAREATTCVASDSSGFAARVDVVGPNHEERAQSIMKSLGASGSRCSTRKQPNGPTP
jgi:hypothetical protein